MSSKACSPLMGPCGFVPLILLFLLGIENIVQAQHQDTATLVFTDGTRMRVRTYATQGGLVILRTLDGKLQSVPGSMIDLKATEETNGGSAVTSPSPPLEPEPRSPFAEDRAKDSRVASPEPALDGLEAPSADLTHPMPAGERDVADTEHREGGEVAQIPKQLDGLGDPLRSTREPESRLPGSGAALIGLGREERVRRLQGRSWEITAAPVQAELRIDGRVDDPAWRFAEPITDLYQRETNEGLPATEPTHVWVLFDDTNLYVGFRCFDRDPNRPRARTVFRDENVATDDAVSVMLDAFNDHRGAIQLATNANGIVFDMIQNGQTPFTRNLSWDAVWTARGSQTEEGWEAEIAIPFKSLRFEPPASGTETIFGIGFKRNLPRKNEETYWPFVSNDSTWYRPSELGHLRGLRDIRPGRSIELRPYGLVATNTDKVLQLTDQRKEVGLDAKWGLTSGLTADFTVNTDFAQEEVDVQQINFTRFSLFFPEKRQLFLEGERMFQFGVRREADLVFTRRIGLSSRGQIIPIIAGGRLSGRQGPYTIGAMNMQTDEEHGLPSENFTVLRVRRDILGRSSVGALFTNREGGGSHNRVYGADVNLFIGRDWSFEGFVARVDETGATEGADSAYARVEYDTDRFGVIYRYLDIGEGFRPGIGFVRRKDLRQNFSEVRYSPRPRFDLIRQFHFTAAVDHIANQNEVLETRQRSAEFSTTFESGDQISVRYQNQFEFIDQPFRLRSDIAIPPGTYRFDTFEARLDTFGRRHARLNLSFNTGGFWSGERQTLSVETAYRINKHLDVSGDYAVNWVDLPEGEFTTHLLSSRVQVAFRNDLVLMSLFQYNHDTRFISSNIRFNWIPKPGTDFFIVYNELDELRSLFFVRNRSLSIKLNYLFAF